MVNFLAKQSSDARPAHASSLLYFVIECIGIIDGDVGFFEAIDAVDSDGIELFMSIFWPVVGCLNKEVVKAVMRRDKVGCVKPQVLGCVFTGLRIAEANFDFLPDCFI